MGMRNAKEEMELLIKNKEIEGAIIENYNRTPITLKVGYTDYEFKTFLQNLDFEYDCGYGGQELYGTVWFKDGRWAERGEYDGSEWWEVKTLPKIPKVLL
jgi:hypothetical protein